MLTHMGDLLNRATDYAIGAFNVYNLEGVNAVLAAAEELRSPVMLQIHPAALEHGGLPLVALCITAANQATIPVGVHLDHCTEFSVIRIAIEAGITSVMADGSHLPYDANVEFTAEIVDYAHQQGVHVEAELGRISGSEDGLTVEAIEARLTNPSQAANFVATTCVDALAVCIGNVHGKYQQQPNFDFDRLHAIQQCVNVPLVLHGASGVPDEMVQQSIAGGIRKFNVNTEVRNAYFLSLQKGLMTDNRELLKLMTLAENSMSAVVREKILLFGGNGKV